MIDSYMRKVKDKLLMILSKTFLFKLSPNFITTVSFILGLTSVGFLSYSHLKLALLFFALNRIMDGLDGLVARELGRQSDFGGYYDIMTDFIIYSLIPLAIAYREGSEFIWMLTAILLGIFYVNGASWMFLSGLLEKEVYKSQEDAKVTSLVLPRGVVEGTETIVFYTFMIILPAYHQWYLIIMGGLTFLGIPQRIIFARKKLH